jgi:hypothetical protein
MEAHARCFVIDVYEANLRKLWIPRKFVPNVKKAWDRRPRLPGFGMARLVA